jgi:hypothetical protein
MKLFIPAALLVVSATTLQAQEPARIAAEPTPIVAPAPAKWTATPALTPAPAPATDQAASTVTSKATATKETSAKSASVVRAQPANFWWMVGAIVLAGVILAVLL